MPTYDYRCRSCGHTFEAMQPITAEPLRNCPECGGAVKRLVGGGIGLIFKGSGFYITDYGRKGSGGSSGAGKSKAKGEATTGEKAGSTAGASESTTSPAEGAAKPSGTAD